MARRSVSGLHPATSAASATSKVRPAIGLQDPEQSQHDEDEDDEDEQLNDAHGYLPFALAGPTNVSTCGQPFSLWLT